MRPFSEGSKVKRRAGALVDVQWCRGHPTCALTPSRSGTQTLRAWTVTAGNLRCTLLSERADLESASTCARINQSRLFRGFPRCFAARASLKVAFCLSACGAVLTCEYRDIQGRMSLDANKHQ